MMKAEILLKAILSQGDIQAVDAKIQDENDLIDGLKIFSKLSL